MSTKIEALRQAIADLGPLTLDQVDSMVILREYPFSEIQTFSVFGVVVNVRNDVATGYFVKSAESKMFGWPGGGKESWEKLAGALIREFSWETGGLVLPEELVRSAPVYTELKESHAKMPSRFDDTEALHADVAAAIVISRRLVVAPLSPEGEKEYKTEIVQGKRGVREPSPLDPLPKEFPLYYSHYRKGAGAMRAGAALFTKVGIDAERLAMTLELQQPPKYRKDREARART